MTTNPGPEPRWKQRYRDIIVRLDGWIPAKHVRESLERLAKNTEEELMRAEHANRERVRRRGDDHIHPCGHASTVLNQETGVGHCHTCGVPCAKQ